MLSIFPSSATNRYPNAWSLYGIFSRRGLASSERATFITAAAAGILRRAVDRASGASHDLNIIDAVDIHESVGTLARYR